MNEVLDSLRSAYPRDWGVKRLKYAVVRGRSDCVETPTTEVSFCPMPAVGARGELDTSLTALSEDVNRGFTRFEEGDIVVAKITPCFENGKGALATGLHNGIGYGTTELHVLTPGADLDGRFLYYATVSTAFRRIGEAFMSGSAGQKRVPSEYVQSFPLGLPQRNVQTAIASFLDRETAEIDELVTEKEKMLRILEEKRGALITRAVTRGIDPKAKMKPSGVEWIADIPEYWSVLRLKHVSTDLQTGPFGSQLHAGDYVDEGTPLVNPADVADGRIKDDPAAKVDQETCKRLSRHILREGDIVFARRGELGRCAVVTPREDGWMCGTGSLRVRLEKAQVDPEFLALYVRYTGAADELVLKSVGSTMDNLNTDILGNLPVVMPPLSEQVGIVHRLHDELRGTVDLTTTLRDSLRLLSERRSALITAAVTGKIAMPGMN